jgi:hypothetical protein
MIEPDTKFNKVYSFIGNTMTIVSGFLAFVSWIISEIAKYINFFPKNINNFAYSFLNLWTILFIIGIVLIFVRLIYVAIKSRTESNDMQRKVTKFLHQNLIHKVRNDIVELEILTPVLIKYVNDGNNDALLEFYDKELLVLKSKLKGYVDCLASYLTKYRSNEISVCIKVFKNRDRNRTKFLEEEIITFARSSNTEKERNNSNITTIGANTDFANLCRGQIVFFASSNLNKIEKSGQYINDSVNWKNSKYISTLVIPIRYYNNAVTNNNNNIKSDVIGFLCIDSKEEIIEWESSNSFELQLLASFADILYVYIKEFYNCFEKYI